MIALLVAHSLDVRFTSKSVANLGTAAPRRGVPPADLLHKISCWRGSVSSCAGGVDVILRSWN